MQLTLLTPHRKILDGASVDEVFAPGIAGQLDILENHANFVTTLETGVLRWRQGSTWQSASISTGLLEIFNGHVSAMAEVSEMGEEIDLNRAKAAETKARQKIEEGGLDDTGLRKYELKLQRAMARQEVATSGK